MGRGRGGEGESISCEPQKGKWTFAMQKMGNISKNLGMTVLSAQLEILYNQCFYYLGR